MRTDDVTCGAAHPTSHASEMPKHSHRTRPERSAARQGTRVIRSLLKSHGSLDLYRELKRPRLLTSLFYVGTSWCLILLGSLAVSRISFWLLPLSLLLVASRQRSMVNNLHDASHRPFFTRGGWGRQVLLALPMFEDALRYRKRHLRHHAHLGVSGLDPDLLAPCPPSIQSFGALYSMYLSTTRAWQESLWGQLPSMSGRERLRTAVWWAAFLGLLAAIFGPRDAAWFAGLWMISRATLYHAIRTFTEVADHGGLAAGTISSFTRNSPSNALSLLIHPHHDNYHLVHHLLPDVPMANLPAAHRILLAFEEYRNAHHCDGYFSGRYPVVSSVMRPKPLVSGP